MSVDVPELTRELLRRDTGVTLQAPGGVVVGPAGAEAIEAGCVVVAEGGTPEPVLEVSMVARSVSVRCVATELDYAARIAEAVNRVLNDEGARRRVVHQPSDGKQYLVHLSFVTSGPTQAEPEVEETYEMMLTATLKVGTQPVPA